MKKLALALLIATSAYGAEVLREEKISGAYIEKIQFDDHTYIHYRNWSARNDSAFFHDPSCECGILTQKRIKEVRELIRNLDSYKEEKE